MSMPKHVLLAAVAVAAIAVQAGAQTPSPAPTPDAGARQTPPERPLPREDARRARMRLLEERIRRAEEQQRRADARRGPEYTEAFSRTVTLGRTGTFELLNPSGDVVITGGRGDALRIDATKRVRHQDESQARSLLQNMQILVSERSGLVDVRTVFPRARNWYGAVDYTIALPDSANVVIRTMSGDLRLTNVRGDLRAESVSGDIVASAVGRVRALRTVSGDLQLTDAEGQDVTAGTVSGDLTVRDLKAQSMTVESVSGNLRLTDVELDRANLRSVSGDLEYRGRLARGGRYDLQSHSGDILVSPSGGNGFDLEAGTFSGDVRSDFEFRTTRDDDGARGRGGRGRSIRGTVGDAGAILTLRSFSGDVTVTRP
jgi:DUF4097 and DUF4098 domain-containing protein YvlB